MAYIINTVITKYQIKNGSIEGNIFLLPKLKLNGRLWHEIRVKLRVRFLTAK